MSKKKSKKKNNYNKKNNNKNNGSANRNTTVKKAAKTNQSRTKKNSENIIKVKQEAEEQQSQLLSVMSSMEKLNNKNDTSKKSEKTTLGDNTDVNKVDKSEETLMDFSKIDDEYKGELRRKLTPKERFFRTCEKFGDLFLLNVFFTITSIPVVTIGASFTALYTMTFKMVRNEDEPIKAGYFKAFKRNFKQATQLWIIVMALFAFVGWQLKIVFSSDSAKMNMLVMVIGLELLLLSFMVPLLFPFVARYENTNLNMIKNSLLASFLHLGTWATVFFLWTIPVVIYYLKPHVFFYTWYLWFVFLASFVAYTCSYRLRSMFDKIEEDPVKEMIEDQEQKNG